MTFTCGAPYQGDDPTPRCVLTWPHHDRLHEDGAGDRWHMSHKPPATPGENRDAR